jgi:glycosyltransferase involved in cell wall biosynthesis
MHDSRAARRLLFLLPFPPRLDATHGGGRVTAQLISRLSSRYRIALLYLHGANDRPVDEALRQRCEIVEPVTRPEGHWFLEERWSRLSSLLQGRPLWAVFTAVAAYRTRLRALVQSWDPDIIQIEYHVMGQYLSALESCPAPRVLVEHEPGVMAAHDLWQSHKGLRRSVYYLNLLAWRRFETAVVKKVQTVVAFTERDRQEIARFGWPTPIIRIPIGTDVPQQSLNTVGCLPLSLVFVGSFGHPPNVDAAMRLVTTIFPRVQAKIPQLMLYLVGDEPPKRIRRLATSHIIVTGRVPDVTPYLDSAALVVAPLRLGGGMRVKVLEAIAAGKPLVASPLAIEGLDLVNGEHLLLADSDEQFSKALIQLLTDADKRVSLGTRARAWARVNLSWEKSITRYEELYEELLAGSCEPLQGQ